MKDLLFVFFRELWAEQDFPGKSRLSRRPSTTGPVAEGRRGDRGSDSRTGLTYYPIGKNCYYEFQRYYKSRS